jgi:diguanylate cyclase (GGDEF)-like protein
MLKNLGLAAVLLLAALAGAAHALPPSSASLPTLTSVRAVHSLSAAEARRLYPVHLRAVVTYYDPYIDPRHAAMFVHDRSGGVFVAVPPNTLASGGQQLASGMEVEITGLSAPGDFAAVVQDPFFRVLSRKTAFPDPRRVSMTQLLSGAEDCEWVEVEGTVQSMYELANNVVLDIAMTDGTISATTVKVPGVNYAGLIDARIRLRAAVAPLFNADRQLTGARLFFPDLSAVTIEKAAPNNPFSLPPTPINEISRFTHAVALSQRVHVRGAVTLQWPRSKLCVQDATQGVCVQSLQDTPVPMGKMVDILGFVSIKGEYRPTLVNATFRPGGDTQLAAPTPISPEQALRGNFDAELVQIEGQLIGIESTAAGPVLILSAHGEIFPVQLPPGSKQSVFANLKTGSKLRLTGICRVQVDTEKTQRGEGGTFIKSFLILLRSPADLIVLETPSNWTASRILLLLLVVLLITVAVLGWVFVLRRRVEQQTRLIRESEERFRHLAHHDALTGLPTRTLLHDRLQGALDRARRSRASVALIMLDLDNFKQVNDSLGHAAGDQTLCVTARRITSVIRKTDTVARMGGDEFVVLLGDVSDLSSAQRIAKNLVAALSIPIRIGDREIPISASVGVHAISNGETDAEALLKSADAAMYHAKARGRNCFEVFNTGMERAALEKMELQVGLSRALELNELRLQYQAVVDVKTGELIGFEALLRWHSRQLGVVMPTEFIPIAEASGIIVPIGDWVLRQACRDMALLESLLHREFVVSVNISPRQLVDDSLPRSVANALAKTGIPPSRLWLEITENILLNDSASTRNALNKIRNIGVKLAIDDFGIGFSSLSYITRFAVDWIKIDRSLLRNCITERNALAVFRAIVAMAHGLDMKVVAEGVETAEQLALLKDEGCDTAQGYFISQPMDAADLPGFISTFAIEAERTPGLSYSLFAKLPAGPLVS